MRRRGLALSWFGLAVASMQVVACNQPPPAPEPEVQAKTAVDDLRADAREGLDAALDHPVPARALERVSTQLASSPELIEAVEKLLARIAQQPELATPTAEFFEFIQASPGMRATLADYARANPQLDLAAITAGFVSHVDAKLTRTELATMLEALLAERLARAGPSSGATMLRKAGGIAQLADHVVNHLADPSLGIALDTRVGRDPQKRAERLHQHLSDASDTATILVPLIESLDNPANIGRLVTLLDDPTLAPPFANALAKLLQAPDFRQRAAQVFAQALATDLDRQALERELDALLALPVVKRETQILLTDLARLPIVRTQIAALIDNFAATSSFEIALLESLD